MVANGEPIHAANAHRRCYLRRPHGFEHVKG